MVEQHGPPVMQDGEAGFLRRTPLQRAQGAGGEFGGLHILGQSLEDPGGRLIGLGVEVAADCEPRVRVFVEQAFDEKPSLKSLPLSFQASQIIGLRPMGEASPTPIFPRARQKGGARRAQMQVDEVELRPVWRGDARMQQRAVEGDSDWLAAMEGRPLQGGRKVVMHLPMGRDGPSAEDRQIVYISRSVAARPDAVDEVKPVANAAFHELLKGQKSALRLARPMLGVDLLQAEDVGLQFGQNRPKR